MKRLAYLAVVLLCLACQSGSETTAVPPVETTAATPGTTTGTPATTQDNGGGSATVTVSDFSFAPSSVTLSVGESVTWALSEGVHTSSSGSAPDLDGIWDEALTADEPFTFTFDEPGTYTYFCRFHPDFMTGTVTVEP